MSNLSFSISLLLLIAIFNSCLCDHDHQSIDTKRETLEIIIGGGGGPAPAPENEECPPPPPPEPECPPPPPPPSPRRTPKSPPPPIPKPPPPPPPSPRRTPKSPPPPIPKPPPPPIPRGCVYRNEDGCFESRRIANAYKVIRDFKNIVEKNEFTKTWEGNDVCKYKGFKCDIRPDKNEKAVAAVDFNGGGFCGKDGTLPLNNFIDRLEDLAIFHANSNNFTGTIPVIEISKINFLYELDLSNNKLVGDFPVEVLKAKNLTFLDIRFNTFNGQVRPEVFKLDLDVLFINNNKLRQQLPKNLGDTPALYLTFANNFFNGPIPRSIGRAPNLLEVLFLNNQFSGCLPYEIGNLSQATVFDVGSNKLWGRIPYSFGCLKKIELLNLANNEFYGEVPELVCQLPKLENLSLSNNYFTQVGPSCRDLIMKKKLDVRNNCIFDLPSQRSKAQCADFFSSKKGCDRPESFKWIPCMKGKQEDSKLTDEKSDEEESTVSSSSSARTYSVLNPHRHRL